MSPKDSYTYIYIYIYIYMLRLLSTKTGFWAVVGFRQPQVENASGEHCV